MDANEEREILIGFSEGKMCYKVYCMAKKTAVRVSDVTLIQRNDEKLFIDQDRIYMEKIDIYLATKHRSTIKTKVIKKPNLFMKTLRKEMIKHEINDNINRSTKNTHNQLYTNSKLDLGIGANDNNKFDVNVDVKEDNPISVSKITIKLANVHVPTISISPAKFSSGKLGRPRGSKYKIKEKVETNNCASIQPIKQDEGKDAKITRKEVAMIADEVNIRRRLFKGF